jgi:DNA gyrase subunit A
VVEGDEVLSIKQSGTVTRSAIDENLRPTGRDTKGVKFVDVGGHDSVVAVARSMERAVELDEPEPVVAGATIEGDDVPTAAPGNADGQAVDPDTEDS